VRIIRAKDYEDLSHKAASIVAGQLLLKDDSVLGLATGSTPMKMYQELVKMHLEKNLDFSEVKTFNLDEYIGLNPENENSYHYYMRENFFKYVNISPENTFLPNGMAENVEKECEDYELQIRKRGGVDLQILGIGKNGHIGFNEPDLKFEATTHMVKLDQETIKDNARFFATVEEVPKYAISMGIKTIMNAKKIILLIHGSNKVGIVKEALYGKITPQIPGSVLQLHPDVTVIMVE